MIRHNGLPASIRTRMRKNTCAPQKFRAEPEHDHNVLQHAILSGPGKAGNCDLPGTARVSVVLDMENSSWTAGRPLVPKEVRELIRQYEPQQPVVGRCARFHSRPPRAHRQPLPLTQRPLRVTDQVSATDGFHTRIRIMAALCDLSDSSRMTPPPTIPQQPGRCLLLALERPASL